MPIGPSLAFCDHLHATKYRLPGETFPQFVSRFSTALGEGEKHRGDLHEIIGEMRFCPAGRVQAWAGSPKVVTPYNCYVSPTINDSFVDGPKVHDGEDPEAVSIMDTMKYAAQTMRQGGGIGYDWSTLRPANAIIKGVMSTSDGPIAFMPIADAVCQATSSAGDRRGAEMSVLRCDHPDIEAFIVMKRKDRFLTGMNISVGITDEFMEAVARGSTFDLRFNGIIYKTVDARELWELIMLSTWDWAEPGVLFLDTINRMNNLWYCEKIAATNPCGEQPLPPWGACLLGSVNLPRYVSKNADGNYWFNFDLVKADIPVIIRAMDRVVDLATYPLPQQQKEAMSKRRMGIGVMGLANAVEALGHPYGSYGFIQMTDAIEKFVTYECYRASIDLAKEKGAFPLFDAEKYSKGEFIKGMPDDILYGIARYGIRNSHLTSYAPTGTISLGADNTSGGIEPVFALTTEREVKLPGGSQMVTLEDYGLRVFGVRGRTTAQVTPDEHVAVLVTSAANVDSAVSKTINVDKHVGFEGFKDVYLKAYEGGAKGCTTFNKDGKKMALLKDKDEDGTKAHPGREDKAQPEACYFDPATGTKSCE